MIFLRALILSLTVMTFQVAAAESNSLDVLGSWKFQTTPYHNGHCQMSGTMHVAAPTESGVHMCELTATEACTNDTPTTARQSCTLRTNGRQVSIISTVEEILEPIGGAVDYWPDNFTLTLQDENRMYGALVSFVSAPAEFKRATDGIS